MADFTNIPGLTAAAQAAARAMTVRPTNGDQDPLLLDVLGDLFNVRSFSDLADAFAKGKTAGKRDYNTGIAGWSNAAYGLPEVQLPPAVYAFSSPQLFQAAMGAAFRGMGGPGAVVLLYTGSTGDFLTLETPIDVDLRNISLLNGTLAAAGPSGRQRIQLYDQSASASSARGLLFSDVNAGATNWLVDRCSLQGWADAISPVSTSNVNCDNLKVLNSHIRWCRRGLVMNNDNSVMMFMDKCKLHHIYDAAVDIVKGGHFHCQDIDLIIPGTFVRIAKMEDGQSPVVLRNVRQEGYQNYDATKKPIFLDVVAGNEGEIIIENWENLAATDATSTVLWVRGAKLDIVMRNCAVSGLANITPLSYSVFESYGRYCKLKQYDCRKPFAPASITRGTAAGDGGSKYGLKYRGCGGTPDQDVPGATGGTYTVEDITHVVHRTGTGTTLARLQASGGPNPETIVLPATAFAVKQRITDLVILTGSSVGDGSCVAQLYSDAGLTAAVGSPVTLAAASTIYSISVPATVRGTQFWLKLTSSGAQDVRGHVEITFRPCEMVVP